MEIARLTQALRRSRRGLNHGESRRSQKVAKRYGNVPIVHGIDLTIADGEFVVLVGPSGCGKSTTLRMIAGLESVTSGEISIGGRVVNTAGAERSQHRHGVPELCALPAYDASTDNIAFGSTRRAAESRDRRRRCVKPPNFWAHAAVGTSTRTNCRAASASASPWAARSCATRSVFLFDEPLSNLDAQLRGQMRTEIKRLHQRIGTTIVYVTHDQVEAMTLGRSYRHHARRPHRAGRNTSRSIPRSRQHIRRRLHRHADNEPAGLCPLS